MSGVTLQADWTWIDGAFAPDRFVTLGADGRIAEVGDASDAPKDTVRLLNRALLPGFVNAHSHAFQRGIRGQAQRRSPGGNDDFWTWREAMYAVVDRLDPDGIRALSRYAFIEMLLAGYTSVGEFHYVHHDPSTPAEDPNALSKAVVSAAQNAGIRIRLLRVAYLRSGFSEGPPSRGQQRFIEPSLSEVLTRCEALDDWCRALDDPRVGMGVAPHSVRAVPTEAITALSNWARDRGRVFHIHAAEQPAEIADCLQYTGQRPVALLADLGVLGPHATLVHATHLDGDEIARIAESGATICVCPSTEADLGDGILPANALHSQGVPFALGSDSQAVIDPFQEMRLLEMHARLQSGGRAQLVDATGSCAGALMTAGIDGGARSLGLGPMGIRPGAPADLVTIALDTPSLAGASPETLAAFLTCHGAGAGVVDVWVEGTQVVEGGRHPNEPDARAAFLDVLARIGD